MFDQDEVYFDEEYHLYFHRDSGKPLVSPSKLIKAYSNPFDPDGKILRRVAAREGVTPKELHATWRKMGDDSIVRGHSIHFSFEHYIQTGQILEDENKDIVKDFKENIQPNLSGVLYPEVTLANKDFGIAGRTDLVHVWWEKIIDLGDFKTNKKITKYSFGKWMLPPLSHLPDANFYHYECQLSLYALLMESRGYCPRNLNIYWINKERKIDLIPVQYRRKDALNLLKHYHEEK